jgi:hypothetical protein
VVLRFVLRESDRPNEKPGMLTKTTIVCRIVLMPGIISLA